jgi:hypothetical protein
VALRTLARRQRLIHSHCCHAEPKVPSAHWFVTSFGRKQ